MTIPLTVTELDGLSFYNCSNLSEVIFLDGKRLLKQDFFNCGFRREEQGLIDQEAVDEMIFSLENGDRLFAFHGCPLTTVKISIGWASSERMARLPRECRLTVEERIHSLRHLELQQDGNVLACFPVVGGAGAEDDSEDEAEDDTVEIRDTNHETARSLYQVLQLIAFHELKESSIVIELAMWKSRIDSDRAHADCRVAIPDTAKTLIMEYCGFAGFLEPAIEGA